ncbi:SAM-dependent methyltransferase [Celeribacter baekdonensis]|uniref:Type 11 methyltransferase n=1 Tax=Celeribacter baekdonensis B30 TaxID=1208323 RepID=K2JDY6_9RHOB|nr:class I SAM-dependent methyltransferase [Celeribacter baekdonensis]EKE68789.1 type 11 methyltransferase [Celeribacter baekdonensis B30]
MSFWDQRYDRPDYVFGTEPAAFLPRHLAELPQKARVLCVADGEGRNSVWLAEQGLDVTAFDPSAPALAKARALAQARGVAVDYHQAGIEDWDWDRPFDLIVAIYIQFIGPEARAALFQQFDHTLAPGGRVMIHGYTPKQVDYGTGGPGKVENMYTEALLATAFDGYDIIENRAFEMHVNEGHGHVGHSALIDFIAQKPKVAG